MDELKQRITKLSTEERWDLYAYLLKLFSLDSIRHTPTKPLAVGVTYVSRMNEILGINILHRDRHPQFLWGRNCVIWKMTIDGFTENEIATVIPLNPSTICNSRKNMRNALKYPGACPFANELWNKFNQAI